MPTGAGGGGKGRSSSPGKKIIGLAMHFQYLAICLYLRVGLRVRPSKIDYIRFPFLPACMLFANTTKFSLYGNLLCMDF